MDVTVVWHLAFPVFLVLTGLLAGVLFAVEIAVVPMLGRLAGPEFTVVHRLLDPGFDPLMPRISKVGLLAGIAAAILAPTLASSVLTWAAIAALVGVAVVSEAVNVRLNRVIDSWDGDRPPEDWQPVRRRWARANRVRTLFAVASFLLAVLAAALS